MYVSYTVANKLLQEGVYFKYNTTCIIYCMCKGIA